MCNLMVLLVSVYNIKRSKRQKIKDKRKVKSTVKNTKTAIKTSKEVAKKTEKFYFLTAH